MAVGSWLALALWACWPPLAPSRLPLWTVVAYPLLHLAVAGVLYRRAVPAPPDPAYPARLRLLIRRARRPPLRAVSWGGDLWPVVVIQGPWETLSPAQRRALLAHEAHHLAGRHMLWLPALGLGLIALLPQSFGSLLVAFALCATLNRRLERAADRRAAHLVSPTACRDLLTTVGEEPGCSRLDTLPLVCLLLTHPPLTERLAALPRRA